MSDSAGWARGSRFYRIGSHALYLSAVMVYIAMAFRPESISESIGVFGGVSAVLLGGGTWVNAKERDVMVAQARTGQDVDPPGGTER